MSRSVGRAQPDIRARRHYEPIFDTFETTFRTRRFGLSNGSRVVLSGRPSRRDNNPCADIASERDRTAMKTFIIAIATATALVGISASARAEEDRKSTR